MSDTRTHALIVGKFYPPHEGHHLLVRTAAATCDRVSVIVMAATVETIPLASRVAWMKEAHQAQANVEVVGILDDVAIDYGDDVIWAQHVDLMRQALDSIGAPAVTHVFTSEAYGDELARRFSSRSVVLDLGRSLVPMSATRIRDDVLAGWGFLSPPARRGLATRVVVVGAESTGTTTLSRDLADRWRRLGGVHGCTGWVAEFGREYTTGKLARAIACAQMYGTAMPTLGSLTWASDEFERIAQEQQRSEDDAAAAGGPLLICDTDALATVVWHERYVGTWREDLLQIRDQHPASLYLVTDHVGVAFEQDGLRDGEHIREWMTQRFLQVLAQRGLPHHLLSGSRAHRVDRAFELTQQLLKNEWAFGAPIPERQG